MENPGQFSVKINSLRLKMTSSRTPGPAQLPKPNRKAAIRNRKINGAQTPLTHVPSRSNALEQEKVRGKAGQIAEGLTRLDLVVLDEPGDLPFSASGGALLFHRLSKLYERTS